MHRLYSFILGLFILCLPALCNAENVTTWNLRRQTQLEGWHMANLTTVNLLSEGLSIKTDTTGQATKNTQIPHNTFSVAITYTSSTGGNGVFIWRSADMKQGQAYQIPIDFVASTEPQRMVLDMSNIPEWNIKSETIGFVISAGTNIVLQKVEFSGPSMTETLWYPVKTFFKFDQARAYSINFLWGPLMTYTQDQYDALLTTFPPQADSWNTVLYIAIAIALVWALWRKRKTGRRAIVAFFLFFACLWILYDARMGAELIGYAYTDVQTWWSKPYEMKNYRDRGSFAAFADLVQQYTKGKDGYIFLASHGWPFWSTLQYSTYPARPRTLEEYNDTIDTWIIYNRSDISLDESNRLILDGKPISPPGKVMLNFEPGSFVFITSP